MKKALILGCFLVIYLNVVGQNFSNLWEAHFSYNKIVGVRAGNNKIYAASENVIFVYDTQTNETFNITTVDGLSGELISAIEYSEAFQILMIGYNNGLIEIYSENDGSILPVVDILERETISPGLKTINHFNEHEGLIYIATGFGIVVYDLERLEFGDTYFIGLGASQVLVEQTAVFNGFIYAACRDNAAIKYADLSNPNLIDFAQWQTISSGNFVTMNIVNNRLYTTRSNNVFNEIVNNTLQVRFNFPSALSDTKVTNQLLAVTLGNGILLLDENALEVSNFGVNTNFQTTYNSAVVFNEFLYVGTETLGLLKVQLSDLSNIEAILPNGPLRNDPFKINAFSGQVWVTYGDYTAFYNSFPLRSRGMSYRFDDSWTSIPFSELLEARNLSYIAQNPLNPQQVFVSSFKDGMLEFNNFEPTFLFNQTNSGLESLILPNNPSFIGIRVAGLAFDRTGKLWSITSRIERPLKSYEPSTGTWQSFSFSQIIDNPLSGEDGFGDLVVDNNGTKWVGSKRNGLIAYNETVSGGPILKIDSQSQNMPSTSVEAIALDNRNQLWIGTVNGLRVLFNTGNIFTDSSPSVNSIIIEERGVPRELLLDELITDIKVDGSNNKWVGTLSSGVFYFSQDGQQTIFHFTRDNSPLPSNQVNDIAIDDINGKVFFATSRGLVAFTSGSSSPQETLGDAFVYPNPVRPEYDILGDNNLNDINRGVKIKGLTENVNIKITDVEGNLVAEAQSRRNLRNSAARFNMAIDGGIAIWNGRNLANNIVASGVYLILITDLDSFETKVLKLLIIRGK